LFVADQRIDDNDDDDGNNFLQWDLQAEQAADRCGVSIANGACQSALLGRKPAHSQSHVATGGQSVSQSVCLDVCFSSPDHSAYII
jgi:hypothetical protein